LTERRNMTIKTEGADMSARHPLERRAHARIRESLNEWAKWQIDKAGLDFPSEVSFVRERVQSSRSTETGYAEMPDDLVKLNREIDKLAPGHKRIVALEYLDRRPQKCKAADLDMPRQVFSARLLWIHEHLSYAMWS
jgi:hypothetical protein